MVGAHVALRAQRDGGAESLDLAALLPLGLTPHASSATASIAKPPTGLALDGAPPRMDPQFGDIADHAPSGNRTVSIVTSATRASPRSAGAPSDGLPRSLARSSPRLYGASRCRTGAARDKQRFHAAIHGGEQ